jgi:hypothetical protein
MPRSAAVDILPLWLGAGLVLRGEDPLDPVAAEAQFAREGLPLSPGGFYSYYPPTASVLALPLRPLGFRRAVEWFRLGAAFATPLGVGFAAAAAFPGGPGGWRRSAPVAGWLAWGAMCARPSRVVLATGQVGPYVVLALGLALFLLARGRTFAAALVAGGAAAGKVAGVVLLPALLLRGRGRALAAFFAIPAGAFVVLAAAGVPVHPAAWASSVAGFATRGLEPGAVPLGAGMAGLLALRLPAVGAAFAGVAARAGWLARPGAPPVGEADAAALAAVALAAMALLLAGSPHYHEALLVLPAAAWGLAWAFVQPRRPLAWAATLSIAATLAAAPGAFAPDGPRAALHWLPVAAAALVAAVLRAALPGTLRGEADSGAA